MAAKSNFFFWLATIKKVFSSETAWPNGAKLNRKHLCKILYKVSSFRFVWPTNMAAKSNSCFWLANVKQIFSPETPWPNGTKLATKHLFTILYKASSYGSIWPTNMATKSNSFFWLATVKKSSPLKLLGQMDPNLAGSIYVRSSIKFLRFIPFGQQIWLPRAILVSDWLMLNKSPLKLLGQIKPNLAGNIYVRSPIKLLHLVPIGQKYGRQEQFLFLIG